MLTTTFALPVLAVALAAKAAPTKQLDEYPPYYPDYPAVETNPTLEERYLYCPKPRYRCHEACLDYRSVCCIDVHNRGRSETAR